MERVQIRGLPEGDYQVQCKTTDGWQKLFQTILPEILSTGSKGYYYIFAQNGSCNFGRSKYDDVEEVSYEDWKEAIETHIERVGDYKVGDIVYITKGYFDLSAGEIRSLEGFDGRHWWVKTKNHPKLYLDIGEYFRHATEQEIAAQSNPPKPGSITDYTYSNIKGKDIAIHCPTQELWDKVLALIPNCRLNSKSAKEFGDRRCVHPCHWHGSYSPIEFYKDEGYQIITAEEFIAANEKKREPKYKVGDWVVVTQNKGGDPVGTVTQITRFVGTNHTVHVKNMSSKCKYPKVENWTHTVDDIRPATPDEISAATLKAEPIAPVRKDGWKVGDKLPVEFLNLCTYYTDIHDIHSATNVEDDDGEKWVHDRVVKTVTSKGWAEISGTSNLCLSPKHEYPEYEHYEKPKAAPKAESPIIVTKANAAIGMQVVRGRDWVYSTQDHFEGKPSVGTIVRGRGYFPSNPESVWVIVKWKNGEENNYRIGEENEDEDDGEEKFDLYVYQGSTEPVQQPVAPMPSKREEEEEKKEVKKSIFVECIDMTGSNASFVVGQVYEVKKDDTDFYYFNHTGSAMFKKRFKEVKGDNPIQIPVGWKPGDSWRHRDDNCGLSISVHPKDDDFNSYFIDYGENGTGWTSVNQINDFVKTGKWIINPKEEKQSQTIISKQTNTKTKQNENIKESSIGISITEQCFITSCTYKFSKAAYIPGDEERITKGQRRQGSTVRS